VSESFIEGARHLLFVFDIENQEGRHDKVGDRHGDEEVAEQNHSTREKRKREERRKKRKKGEGERKIREEQ
jgi:hypothetical protein